MIRDRIKKYTDIQPVVMEDFPDAHNVFLQVTNQRFCVTPHGCDTKEDAEWMRDMLCVALEKIVTDELARDTTTDKINKLLAELRAEKEARASLTTGDRPK